MTGIHFLLIKNVISRESIEIQIVVMYDQWIEAFDILSTFVMVDLSAAFDVVEHRIIIQKLEIY